MPVLKLERSILPENLLEGFTQDFPESRWWAVYTKARREKALARHLVRRQIPFFLPLVAKVNLIRGRKVRSHNPLFGGYLFLFADDHQRVEAWTSNRISQVVPAPRDNRLCHDLSQLRKLIDSNAPLTVESKLAPGNRVRVKKGPLQGTEGVVIERRGETRLLVAVKILQQGVSLKIDDWMLEPIR